MKEQSVLSKILGWIVTILTPLVILMLSVRLLITPVFAQVEYRLPGFPDDPYGFTLEDRLRWSEPSIKYLVNSEGISYLSTLTFEDGEPIYNERELSHMADVKAVVTGMRIALAGAMVILLVVTIAAVNAGWKSHLLKSYKRGGQALLWLIGAILLFVALSFNDLFTWFHKLLFESGTWQFYTSDTLIRLFPMRFWRDAFIFVGVLSALLSGAVILFTASRSSVENKSSS